jgi:ribosomal protein S18 acetylase RimI-like enzyme
MNDRVSRQLWQLDSIFRRWSVNKPHFSKAEAEALVGKRALTMAAWGRVPQGTTGRVISTAPASPVKSKQGRLVAMYDVVIQWDLSPRPRVNIGQAGQPLASRGWASMCKDGTPRAHLCSLHNELLGQNPGSRLTINDHEGPMHAETGSQSTDQLSIRAYRDDDWLAVCAVHDRARPDELLGSCDPGAFVPLAAEQEGTANFQRSRKFVACLGEQIVGFVGVDGTYLSWLYVDPAYYRQGIGRRLLRLGVALIGPQAWTVALVGNMRAQQLYESEGFQVVRTFESTNAGYPCTCAELALSPPTLPTAGSGGEGQGEAGRSAVTEQLGLCRCQTTQ